MTGVQTCALPIWGYGLEEFFTPLRLRGLEAALLRLQAQVRKALTS